MIDIRAFLGLGALAAIAYFFSKEASASTLPSIPRFSDVANFDPYVEVETAGEQMTDKEYAWKIIEAGLNPADYGYADPRGTAPAPVENEIISEETFMAETPKTIAPAGTPEGNLSAFLALIRELESKNDYYALVGGGQFSDTSDHPANLGWPGIQMPGGYRTAAAGAYQIQPGTMREAQQRAGIPKGFDPATQDQLAIAILQFPWRQGAYYDVINGNFDSAFRKLTKEWEAFERILAGQYHYTFDQAKTFYAQNGGTFA